MDLSVIIPSRNELFLAKTIEDVLSHIELDTEIIAVLDGAWSDPPVADNPRLTLIHHSRSVGQRAACNEAARLAKGKYVMKLDAHCAVDQGFDCKLLADMQDDWTMVPVMRNEHVFDFVCPDGHRRYQGPSGPCKECGKPTTRDVVWIAKTNPQSTAYCFDPEPHFQYDGNQKERQKTQGDLVETMSLQGSCFLMTRERYFALNVCDESLGSWGSQGIEVACKTWLSGGRVICNKHTYYGHLFRGKGENWGFPYPISGRQTESAKRKVKELFFENKWPLQVRPLSWLLDRFWPVPGWTDEELVKITQAGELFWKERAVGIPLSTARLDGHSPVTSSAYSTTSSRPFLGGKVTSPTEPLSPIEHIQQMSVDTVRLNGIESCGRSPSQNVLPISSQSHVERIDAVAAVTEMVDAEDIATMTQRQRISEPCVHDSMQVRSMVCAKSPDAEYRVPIGCATSPQPAASSWIDRDPGKNPTDVCGRDAIDAKIGVMHDSVLSTESCLGPAVALTAVGSPIVPSKAMVYYTDNRLDPAIMTACQRQLGRCRNGCELVVVSLSPIVYGWGDKRIVFEGERSVLTMFRQILAGIEASTADIIYLIEHDVLYHPSHFDFVPPKRDTFYYDENSWHVFADDGMALFYNVQKVSMLVAYRELLLEHYRTRVARVEKEGFTLRLGYEPGNHPFPRGVDMHGHESYWAQGASIDIRHKQTLTHNRRRKDQFRNQKNLVNWTEADEVPGWGVTKGRFRDFLQELVNDSL